jgi:hypothetical protein
MVTFKHTNGWVVCPGITFILTNKNSHNLPTFKQLLDEALLI